MNDLLKEADAAAYLLLKPSTLASWRSSGAGPKYYKIGGAVRYRQSDLEAFIAQTMECPQ